MVGRGRGAGAAAAATSCRSRRDVWGVGSARLAAGGRRRMRYAVSADGHGLPQLPMPPCWPTSPLPTFPRQLPLPLPVRRRTRTRGRRSRTPSPRRAAAALPGTQLPCWVAANYTAGQRRGPSERRGPMLPLLLQCPRGGARSACPAPPPTARRWRRPPAPFPLRSPHRSCPRATSSQQRRSGTACWSASGS